MPPKRKGGLNRDIHVEEDVRIAVNLKIKAFRQNEDEKEYEFPSSFTTEQRAYIHQLAQEQGLKTKSRGKGIHRYITVYKREGSTIMQSDASLKLTEHAQKTISGLLQQHPVTNKERQELLPPDKERCAYGHTEARNLSRNMGKLSSGLAQLPTPANYNPEVYKFRTELPIWAHRPDILQSIANNQVTLITGETGSGKTTQVPQFILEYSIENRIPCKVVCSEPRRLAAVSMAERVAYEREEKVGQTVGFQIRHESRFSPKTLLTFCTNGILLRTLMSGDSALAGMTHVIIDEVHERDRFSDFLLTVIRDSLNKHRGLKVILMSATVDVQLFLNYFTGAKHISVPGRLFPVRELYLEDLLLQMRYETPAMKKFKQSAENKQGLAPSSRFEALAHITKNLTSKEDTVCAPQSTEDDDRDVVLEDEDDLPLTQDMQNTLDQALSDAFLNGDSSEKSFDKLVELGMSSQRALEYKHSQTDVTMLMTASAKGCVPVVEKLLAAGASVDTIALNQWTARDFALCQNHQEVADILESYKQSIDSISCDRLTLFDDSEGAAGGDSGMRSNLSNAEKEALRIYQNTFNDDKVDHELIVAIINYIHQGSLKRDESPDENGSILVFLPGYEDLVTIRDLIRDNSVYCCVLLHSQMSSIDQKRAFRPPPPGQRKVILSTNIAETSVTVNDVMYVIDSGKVKEKSYDALTSSSFLRMVWISKTSAIQRKGRAGRVMPGTVCRIYSSVRYSTFSQFQVAEILRTPLMELCLHTKLLALPNTPIADFLARAPQPPSFMVTRNAVQMLKTIEALDAWEDVTELGNHLLDLPIEPRLGKMVLYAVVLKCLDPVLTIVCFSAYRDPFLLPSQSDLKKRAKKSRNQFAQDSLSDHMALLRAFQAWQKARLDNYERRFCYEKQISSATMEMVTCMRAQLLAQLRASGFVRTKGAGDIKDLNRHSENWPVIKAALTAGCYPFLARFDRDAQQLRTAKESKVRLHPSSTLLEAAKKDDRRVSAKENKSAVSRIPTDWFIFEELTRIGHLAMIRNVTAVSPVTVLIFAGPNRLPMDTVSEADASVQGNPYIEEHSDSENDEKTDEESKMLRLDDWVVFRSSPELAKVSLQLRQKWSSLFLRRLHFPGKPMSQADHTVIDALATVLSAEDNYLGLQQPSGIGQRPKQISVDSIYGMNSPNGHYSHHNVSSRKS